MLWERNTKQSVRKLYSFILNMILLFHLLYGFLASLLNEGYLPRLRDAMCNPNDPDTTQQTMPPLHHPPRNGTVTPMLKDSTQKKDKAQIIREKKMQNMSRPLGPFEQVFDAYHSFGNYLFTIVLFLRTKQMLDSNLVLTVLKQMQARHPFLRSKITMVDNTLHFVPMGEKMLDFEALDADTYEEVNEDLLTTPMDVGNGPLWRVKLIRMPYKSNGSDSGSDVQSEFTYRNAIIFTFHHAVCDGMSAASLLEEFGKGVDSALKNGTQQPLETLGLLPPLEELLPANDVAYRCVDVFNLLKMAYDALLPGKNHYLAKYPPTVMNNPDVEVKTKVVSFELSKSETEKLIKKCKKGSTSVHGALTAAANIALAKILRPNTSTSVTIPSRHTVNLRYICKPVVEHQHMGMMVMAVEANMKVPRGNSSKKFWKLSKQYSGQVRSGVASKQYTKIMRVFDKVWNRNSFVERGLNGLKSGGRDRNYFTLSNLGNLDRILHANSFSEIDVEDVLTATGIHAEGPIFLHNVLTLRGQLKWHLNYCTNVSQTQQAVEYSYLIHKVLIEALKD